MGKKGKGIADKINSMCKDVPLSGVDIIYLKNELKNNLKKTSANT